MTVAAPAVCPPYSSHVNPQWVRLLNVLEMNVRYERCAGAELFTSDGRTILDFLSGYCVHNVGHNHPDILAALRAELEVKLETRRFAALILEPIQGEGGIRVPAPAYLQEAQTLCRRYGTLLALDEVQTGMYRTGPFLAGSDYGVEPDIVVLAKAL